MRNCNKGVFIENTEVSGEMLLGFYRALAEAIDFHENVDKYDEIFDHYVENPSVDVFDFSNTSKFGLSKLEHLCFNGLMFLKTAFDLVQEIEESSDVDIRKYDILFSSISLGSLIYGILVSRVDIDDIDQRQQFITLKTSFQDMQKFAVTGQKVRDGGSKGAAIKKKSDVSVDAERQEYQSAVDRIMNDRPVSFNRALDLAAKKLGVSRSTLKRRGVKDMTIKKQ